MNVELEARRQQEKRLSDKAERILFAIFLIVMPFQTRLQLTSFGAGEWQEAWIWLSDIVVLGLFCLWLLRGMRLRDLFPMLFLLAFLPSLAANPSGLALWRFLKIAEGLFIVSYVRRHKQWLTESLARPHIFLLVLTGLLANAVAGVVQFALQRDLGLNTLFGESPLETGMPGVANFVSGGAKIIRAYGFTPHPNVLGALLAAGIVLVGFLYVFRGMGRSEGFSLPRQREEIVRALVLFVMVLGILFTFSRVSWVAAAAGTFAMVGFVFIFRSLRRPYMWEAIRLSVVFLAIVLILGIGFWPLLTSRVDVDLSAEQSFSLRSYYAEEAVEMIGRAPATGVGLGHFTEELAAHNRNEPAWSVQPVHNVTLLLAAEAGFPAMAALAVTFAILVIGALRKLRATHDPSLALIQGLALALGAVVLLLSLGDHLLWTSQQGSLLLWIVLGLLA